MTSDSGVPIVASGHEIAHHGYLHEAPNEQPPRAWITDFAQYVLDESDPFPEGFTVGDIWASA